MGLHTEALDSDIAHIRTNHIRGIDSMNWYLSTCNDKGQHPFHATAYNTQLHFRSLLTTKHLHDIDTCHLHTSDSRVVHTDDTVASKDSHFLRWSVDNRLDNDKCIFNHIELHTNTLKVALQRFVHRFGFLCIGVRRMWIELLKHTPNTILN